MFDNCSLFSWEGVNADGKKLSGRCYADSKITLKYQLYKQQIIISKADRQNNKFITLRRWSSSKQTLFFLTQLTALLKTGLNLNRTAEILKENQTDSVLSEFLICLNFQLSNGEQLSTVLSLYPTLFDNIIIQLIKSGEKSGQVDKALQQAVDYNSQKQKTLNQLLTALLYPLMLMLVSVAVLATLVMFVIPQFESIYSQADSELPLITASILRISEWTRENSIVLFVLIISAGFCLSWLKRYKQFQITKYIPKINTTIKKINTLRFCQTLTGLYQAGLTITDCIEACRELSTDNDYQFAIDNTLSEIKKGHGLANALSSSNYFDNLMIQLIRTGEESASLAQMLEQCGSYFDSQLQDNLNRIKILLEPILIVTIGAIIGFILVAMYLPIFNLGNSF